MADDFKYTYLLTKADGIGSVRIKKLLDKFGSARNVLEASAAELERIEGIGRKNALSILRLCKGSSEHEKDFETLQSKMEKRGIGAISYTDRDYPQLLKKIYDPPVVLYFKGKNAGKILKDGLDNCIGIVGTRTPSEYGKKICEHFSEELCRMGITVVSGFARGIDTSAHKAVLADKHAEGKTAAVLGCGVDVIYPPENRKLYESIVENGIIFSEFELSAKPDGINFPRRNRIISGLSLGVVVVESGKEGGALITARCALDQGREVYAVPGDINSKYSKGTHELIKNGQAKLIENVNDILDELRSRLNLLPFDENGNELPARKKLVDLKGNEKLIYDFLFSNKDSVHIDLISETTGLNISDCLVCLLNLEFKGIIRQLPGKMFTIS